MPEDKTRSHSFSMPESMLTAISDVALGMEQSKSYVVRVAVRAYLAKQGYPYPPREDAPDEDEPWPYP